MSSCRDSPCVHAETNSCDSALRGNNILKFAWDRIRSRSMQNRQMAVAVGLMVRLFVGIYTGIHKDQPMAIFCGI